MFDFGKVKFIRYGTVEGEVDKVAEFSMEDEVSGPYFSTSLLLCVVCLQVNIYVKHLDFFW